MIEYGAPIEVNGVMPTWMKSDDKPAISEHDKWWASLSTEEQDKIRAENLAEKEKFDIEVKTKGIRKVLSDSIAEGLGKPGWIYVDIPWLSQDLFTEFVEAIGNDGEFITIMTRGTVDVDLRSRATLLINPSCLDRLKQLYEQ